MDQEIEGGDTAPGLGAEEHRPTIGAYGLGLALAALLTGLAFFIPSTNVIWGPAVPLALIALAIGQIGVHLVFFLHIDTGPDNTNNTLALAFGILIVFLVVAGSVWIMSHLNANMMPMSEMMQMQR